MIENQNFKLQINHESGTFEILTSATKFPALLDSIIGISGKTAKQKKFDVKFDLRNHSRSAPDRSAVEWMGVNEETGLRWSVIFDLTHSNYLMWRVNLKNETHDPVWIRTIKILSPHFKAAGNLRLAAGCHKENLAFFSNGWQSWSYSGAYLSHQKMRRSRLGILQKPMVINPGTPVFGEKGRFSSDFFGVICDQSSHKGLLLGFLSQKQHYGTITLDLNQDEPAVEMWANGDDARLDPGREMQTDWALIQAVNFEEEGALEPFLNAVAREHHIKNIAESPSGWCSWYFYYQNITEGIVCRNLKYVQFLRDQLPLQVFQIDDGYQSKVGDWFSFDHHFPNGVAPLAEEIKAEGLTPGIWLAPFILQPDSETVKKHPHWLLKDHKGRLASPGFVWNSLGAALDITVPEALAYACQVIHTAAHYWGFEYLKLDFLYAAALKGLYADPSKTRAQVMRMGIEALRRAAGEDTFLVGCGAPLGSVLGLVQAMRIGADVSADWSPKYFHVGSLFRDEPHMPSARNAIQNTLTRAPLHGKWWVNDPDCLLVRPGSNLTLAEIQSLVSAIALTGGSTFLSDDMMRLPEQAVRLASFLVPPIHKAARVLDWIDENTPRKLRIDLKGTVGQWSLVAFFNWRSTKQDVCIHKEEFRFACQDYLVRSIWQETCWISRVDQPLYCGDVSPHGVILLAVRNFTRGVSTFVGSNIHISQGLEIEQWKMQPDKIQLSINNPKKKTWFVDIYSMREIENITGRDQPLKLEKTTKDIYRIHNLRADLSKIALNLK